MRSLTIRLLELLYYCLLVSTLITLTVCCVHEGPQILAVLQLCTQFVASVTVLAMENTLKALSLHEVMELSFHVVFKVRKRILSSSISETRMRDIEEFVAISPISPLNDLTIASVELINMHSSCL